MIRYAQNGPHDTAPELAGDAGFAGVNAKDDPALLTDGMVQRAVNLRFVDGTAVTRPGIIEPAWTRAGVTGPFFGSGVYSDPDDVTWLLLATASGVWRLRDGRTPQFIALAAGETIAATCELIQCFSKVILFRGLDAAPLAWDGRIISSFAAIEPSAEGSGTETIPNADTAELFGDSLIVPLNRDELIFSDRSDYTHFDPVFSQAKINKGTSEKIVRIFPFTTTSVLVLKERSIFVLSNLFGTFADNAKLEVVNNEIGCYARRSVAMVGGDALFLSDTGVYRVTQVVQERLQTASTPVSDPIEPIMRRVNWKVARAACAAVFGRYYYLAVPLDGALVNNAILVLDTITGQWQGYDTAAFTFGVNEFQKAEYQGEQRLFAIDRANSHVFVVGEGRADQVGDVAYSISASLTTRGYPMRTPTGVKRWRRTAVALATWWPSYTVAVQTDGVNEVQPLAQNQTRDRTKYSVFGVPDYDPSNANQDQLSPHRYDYSVDPSAGARFDPQALYLELDQESLERFTLRGIEGRWLAIAVSNAQGTFAVRSITLEGNETKRAPRRAV